VGGETYLCAADGRPQQRTATKDAHFTVLGFTTASGMPLMCAIIFAAAELKPEWASGFDSSAEWIGEENETERNMGEGKVFPLGPAFSYNGKSIPCYCCCSNNVSITGALLKDMLMAIDQQNVFDCTTSLNPFLLLDGHGSQFELEFLSYIHSEDTKWDVCIGLPYGTSYWQVGDSTEQNDCFKMALTKAKQQLVQYKNDCGLDFVIEKEDVVGLVGKAWKASFARTETNVKAICQRGWGPRALNFNVLLHPEIPSSKPGEKQSSALPESKIDPVELNLSGDIATTLIDRIIIHKNKEASTSGDGALERMRKRKANAEAKIASKSSQMTAGLLASSGKFLLSRNVYGYVKENADAQKQKRDQALMKRRDEYDLLLAKVEEIRRQNLPPEKWKPDHLKAMIKWNKRDGDGAIPKRKQEKLVLYKMICSREDLPPSPLLDPDEGVDLLPPQLPHPDEGGPDLDVEEDLIPVLLV